MRTVKTLIRMGGCPGWSKSSLGTQTILLVLSWGGSTVSYSSHIFIFGDAIDYDSALKSHLRFRKWSLSNSEQYNYTVDLRWPLYINVNQRRIPYAKHAFIICFKNHVPWIVNSYILSLFRLSTFFSLSLPSSVMTNFVAPSPIPAIPNMNVSSSPKSWSVAARDPRSSTTDVSESTCDYNSVCPYWSNLE